MKEIRCAIYTRKSTDEGLDKEFNTLEAQREAGENYVLSQKHQGWKIIPEHYDDGGYSGGNIMGSDFSWLVTGHFCLVTLDKKGGKSAQCYCLVW